MWPLSLLRRGREEKSVAFTNDLISFFQSRLSGSGVTVNIDTALQITAVYRCSVVIADSIATVPLKLMRRSDGTRKAASDHPLFDVLAVEPNGWQSSLEYREQIGAHVALAGNSYSFVNRVRGQVVELIPFRPETVTVEQRPDYSLAYKVHAPNGEVQEFPQEAIWHVRGPSWDGYSGLRAVDLGREAMGLSIATEKAHAGRFKHGIQTSGIYAVEGTLNEQQYKDLRGWIERNHAGPENSGGWFLLDRNAKWHSIVKVGT
jgi:HK97 family phage portal protein